MCSNPKTITVVQVKAQNYQWENKSVTGDLVIYYREDEQIKLLSFAVILTCLEHFTMFFVCSPYLKKVQFLNKFSKQSQKRFVITQTGELYNKKTKLYLFMLSQARRWLWRLNRFFLQLHMEKQP